MIQNIKLKKGILIPVNAAFSSTDLPSDIADSIIDNGGNFDDVVEWDTLWLNPSMISCINKSINGKAVVRFGDSGNGWSLDITVEELINLIKED